MAENKIHTENEVELKWEMLTLGIRFLEWNKCDVYTLIQQ